MTDLLLRAALCLVLGAAAAAVDAYACWLLRRERDDGGRE